MLAADDPDNPPLELHALLPPEPFALSQLPRHTSPTSPRSPISAVPFQTTQTLQSFFPPSVRHTTRLRSIPGPHSIPPTLRDLPSRTQLPAGSRLVFLDERSLDPSPTRSLRLLAAVAATLRLSALLRVALLLLERTRSIRAHRRNRNPRLRRIEADPLHRLHRRLGPQPRRGSVVRHRKGQMIAVALPPQALRSQGSSVRTRDLYIVPRITGPSAGRAIIGATIEDVGFDKAVHLSRDRRACATPKPPQLLPRACRTRRVLESVGGPASSHSRPPPNPRPSSRQAPNHLASRQATTATASCSLPATALVMAHRYPPRSAALHPYLARSLCNPARALPKNS